jgi:hypothetical protein
MFPTELTKWQVKKCYCLHFLHLFRLCVSPLWIIPDLLKKKKIIPFFCVLSTVFVIIVSVFIWDMHVVWPNPGAQHCVRQTSVIAVELLLTQWNLNALGLSPLRKIVGCASQPLCPMHSINPIKLIININHLQLWENFLRLMVCEDIAPCLRNRHSADTGVLLLHV